jgi:hypothetical protein
MVEDEIDTQNGVKIMHNLVVGMTTSGKSFFCKLLIPRFKSKGLRTAVLDPLHSQDWNADFQTADPAEFLRWSKANKSCMLFLDEGAESVGRYNESMQWFATQARHWGHQSFFISQGCVQMAPIVRQQCTTAYVFACGERQTEMLAEEWREPTLRNVARIGKGEFFIVHRFKELRMGRIDFEARSVYIGACSGDFGLQQSTDENANEQKPNTEPEP